MVFKVKVFEVLAIRRKDVKKASLYRLQKQKTPKINRLVKIKSQIHVTLS
jgi:hypothetical protein